MMDTCGASPAKGKKTRTHGKPHGRALSGYHRRPDHSQTFFFFFQRPRTTQETAMNNLTDDRHRDPLGISLPPPPGTKSVVTIGLPPSGGCSRSFSRGGRPTRVSTLQLEMCEHPSKPAA